MKGPAPLTPLPLPLEPDRVPHLTRLVFPISLLLFPSRATLEDIGWGCLSRERTGWEEIMQHAMTRTTCRRTVLTRMLLAITAGPVLGVVRVSSADASKKGKNTILSVSDRVARQQEDCHWIGGGTFSTTT